MINASKSYVNGAQPFHALKHLDLTVRSGEFVSILGKSGSGKSTLLNLLSGIDLPCTGKVLVNGEDLTLKSMDKLDAWRGCNIGLVFQFFQLMPTLTALENVMLPMDFARQLTVSERRERAAALLDSVQLSSKLNMFPATLSGGEKQRVAIARALANNADILLADEPTGNLDTTTAEKIYTLFAQLNQQGKTIVVVSHDEKVCDYSSRIIKLADGELLSDMNCAQEASCV